MFIQFPVDASLVGPFLEEKYNTIVLALTNKLNAINYALQAKIVGEKLGGQVLQQRTGKLAGSIRVNEATEDGALIQGGVQGGGGPAYYGKFQEYGVDHPWEILPKDPKGVLAFVVDGKTIFTRKVTHPGLPPRSFMVSALEESRDSIITTLKETVREAAQ